ncbi:hypothetical protein NST07_07905 [Paenibacillus sp. FSL L8-0340]|uniref:hypothetical protein n=1 Tax=Paenibacillus sp. FSL L8-0340 TaxID=2954685 RepID=UPI0031589B78
MKSRGDLFILSYMPHNDWNVNMPYLSNNKLLSSPFIHYFHMMQGKEKSDEGNEDNGA